MIKKFSDKDKKDWENFLQNKKNTPDADTIKNKNLSDKKIIKVSDKDRRDWENFLKNKEKIPNKDFVNKKNIRHEKIKKIVTLVLFY